MVGDMFDDVVEARPDGNKMYKMERYMGMEVDFEIGRELEGEDQFYVTQLTCDVQVGFQSGQVAQPLCFRAPSMERAVAYIKFKSKEFEDRVRARQEMMSSRIAIPPSGVDLGQLERQSAVHKKLKGV